MTDTTDLQDQIATLKSALEAASRRAKDLQTKLDAQRAENDGLRDAAQKSQSYGAKQASRVAALEGQLVAAKDKLAKGKVRKCPEQTRLLAAYRRAVRIANDRLADAKRACVKVPE
jgi:predicted  nucleic acid-binding Zn-ribbon protein